MGLGPWPVWRIVRIMHKESCTSAGNGDVAHSPFSLCLCVSFSLSLSLSLSLALVISLLSRTGHVMLSNVV